MMTFILMMNTQLMMITMLMLTDDYHTEEDTVEEYCSGDAFYTHYEYYNDDE